MKEKSESVYESPLPSEERKHPPILKKNIRGYRYGEIMPVWHTGHDLITEAYNTFTCNDCPSINWMEIKENEEERLRRLYGATKVIMNGQRFWVMDEVEPLSGNLYSKVVSFQGIQTNLGAQIPGDSFGEKLYQEEEVKRWTTWHYKKGLPVFELINDKEERYIMQSYAVTKDLTLSLDNLHELKGKLRLPEGWDFKHKILHKDFDLVTDGLAYVIHDDLDNGYQKVVD